MAGFCVRGFVVLACLASTAFGQVNTGKSDEILGHLKAMVDAYVEKYDEEVHRFDEAEAAMNGVIEKSIDAEAKESAVDEKLKMKEQHDETLAGFTSFIRSLDEACAAMHPGAKDDHWLDQWPETKAKVDAIYGANPVLLAKSLRVVTAHGHAGMSLATARQVVDRASAYLRYHGSSA